MENSSEEENEDWDKLTEVPILSAHPIATTKMDRPAAPTGR